MIARAFSAKCLTNLHVGNGDVNFNIIDKEVERDSVTGYPTINSSGVKGALREYCTVNGSCDIDTVFGGEGDGRPGRIKFLSANMLAIPMRASRGNEPYHLVTTAKAVIEFNTLCRAMGLDIQMSTAPNGKKAYVEGVECDMTSGLSGICKCDVAVMDEDSFRDISLPVIARNKLENGKSTNLWYEEFVPHESVFAFILAANNDSAPLLDSFARIICSEPVQFGGNATVGYGLCALKEIGRSSE